MVLAVQPCAVACKCVVMYVRARARVLFLRMMNCDELAVGSAGTCFSVSSAWMRPLRMQGTAGTSACGAPAGLAVVGAPLQGTAGGRAMAATAMAKEVGRMHAAAGGGGTSVYLVWQGVFVHGIHGMRKDGSWRSRRGLT